MYIFEIKFIYYTEKYKKSYKMVKKFLKEL